MNLPKTGDIFDGRYEIEQWLGSGGFAHVFRATQIDLGRPVALKLLSPSNTSSNASAEQDAALEVIAQRFEREARTISQLRSPQTVNVHDFGKSDTGFYFMALEFVEGVDLHQVLKAEGIMAPKRAVLIVRQVLKSLAEAHEMGVLHRDIKPSNIMLYEHMGDSDLVKVLDFGIAAVMNDDAFTMDRLTQTGSLVGTPQYMAPELIQGDEIVPATDLYSVGLMLYEMLVGEPALAMADGQLFPILMRQVSEEPFLVPADTPISDALRAIVERLIAKDIAERYASALDVIEAIDALAPTDLENSGGAPRAAAPSHATSETHLPNLAHTPMHERVPVAVRAHDAGSSAHAEAAGDPISHEIIGAGEPRPATVTYVEPAAAPEASTSPKARAAIIAMIVAITLMLGAIGFILSNTLDPASPSAASSAAATDSVEQSAAAAPDTPTPDPAGAPAPIETNPPAEPVAQEDTPAQVEDPAAPPPEPAEPADQPEADEPEVAAKDDADPKPVRKRKRRRKKRDEPADEAPEKTPDKTPEKRDDDKGYFMLE